MNLILQMTHGRALIRVRVAALGHVRGLAQEVALVGLRLVAVDVVPAPVDALMDVLGNAQANVQGHAVHLALEIVLMLVTVFAHLVAVVAKMLWLDLCQVNKIYTV